MGISARLCQARLSRLRLPRSRCALPRNDSQCSGLAPVAGCAILIRSDSRRAWWGGYTGVRVTRAMKSSVSVQASLAASAWYLGRVSLKKACGALS